MIHYEGHRDFRSDIITATYQWSWKEWNPTRTKREKWKQKFMVIHIQCATRGNLEQMGSAQMVVQIAFPLMDRKWVGRQLGVPHMIDVLLQPWMGEVKKELLWFCKTNLHYKEFMHENLHLAMWDESLQWDPYYLSENLQFSCHHNMWKMVRQSILMLMIWAKFFRSCLPRKKKWQSQHSAQFTSYPWYKRSRKHLQTSQTHHSEPLCCNVPGHPNTAGLLK